MKAEVSAGLGTVFLTDHKPMWMYMPACPFHGPSRFMVSFLEFSGINGRAQFGFFCNVILHLRECAFYEASAPHIQLGPFCPSKSATDENIDPDLNTMELQDQPSTSPISGLRIHLWLQKGPLFSLFQLEVQARFLELCKNSLPSLTCSCNPN